MDVYVQLSLVDLQGEDNNNSVQVNGIQVVFVPVQQNHMP